MAPCPGQGVGQGELGTSVTETALEGDMSIGVGWTRGEGRKEGRPCQCPHCSQNPKSPPTSATAVMSSAVLSPTRAGAEGIFLHSQSSSTHIKVRAAMGAQPHPRFFLAPSIGMCQDRRTGTAMGTETRTAQSSTQKQKQNVSRGRKCARSCWGLRELNCPPSLVLTALRGHQANPPPGTAEQMWVPGQGHPPEHNSRGLLAHLDPHGESSQKGH